MELIRVNIETGDLIMNNLHLLEKYNQPEDGEAKIKAQWDKHLKFEKWLKNLQRSKEMQENEAAKVTEIQKKKGGRSKSETISDEEKQRQDKACSKVKQESKPTKRGPKIIYVKEG